MKAILTMLMLLAVHGVLAQEKIVSGAVTYVASGTVYTSLGRESGVQDSNLVYIKANRDTIAVLQVFAVSSKSSACRVLKAKRDIRTGDAVSALVVVSSPQPVSLDAGKGPAQATVPSQSVQSSSLRPEKAEPASLELRGRISAQFYSNRYDNPLYNTSQPGLVINLHGRSNEVPLKFELYTNLRTLAYGNMSPFSKQSINQSRIYRLSLEYDDGVNDASVGRIIPSVAPAIGYIDGAMYARRIGRLILGTTLGFQPSFTLRGISTDYKKFALFASVQPVDSLNLSVSSAYSRSYYRTALDREVVSANVSVYTMAGFQVYAYSEFDLRTARGGTFILSPSLTSLYANVSYRLTSFLTVGLGADASRPLYTFSTAQFIPDSLRETRLRSGISTSATFYLPGGVTLSNTYAPRTSESQFARVYSNYTTVGITDIFSSGISLRSNVNLNANEYSSSKGYGVSVQRNIIDIADVNVRYQQNSYTLKNYDDRHLSKTFGTDIIIMISRELGLMMSYDRLNGYGITSNSFFGELSVRF